MFHRSQAQQRDLPLVQSLQSIGNPRDLQEVRLGVVDPLDYGKVWSFKYKADHVDVRKWDFIGGSPLYNFVNDFYELFAPYTDFQYLDASSATISLSMPTIDALYEVWFSCSVKNLGASRARFVVAPLDVAASTAVDGNGQGVTVEPGETDFIVGFTQLNVDVDGTISMQFRSPDDQPGQFGSFSLKALPVRGR